MLDAGSLQAILVSGLILGSLYALMGAGLSMVWGTLRMFNFAHGVLIALGAYLAWTAVQRLPETWGVWVASVLSLVLVFGVGVLLAYLVVQPFLGRKDATLVTLITTLAASIFLQNAIQLGWGPRLKQLPPMVEGSASLLGVTISKHEILIIVITPTLLLLVDRLLKSTRLGLAFRAVEQNQDAAVLTGVNVRVIYGATFGIAALLAAAAGVLLGALRFVTPTMGDDPMLRAVIVVLFGGLGSLPGTVAGAYIIGMIESASTYFFGLYWTPAILFLIMILTLLIKPTGLFGEE